MAKKSVRKRFVAKVKHAPNGCWEWTGNKDRYGYGCFKVNGKTLGAHRFSWIMKNGPIPEGLHVRHKCDNPPCVRPSHLEVGTHQENMDDKVSRGRAIGTDQSGQNNNSAKLDWGIVNSIRKEYAEGGVTYADLSKKYGVNQSAIGHIVKHRTWKTSSEN